MRRSLVAIAILVTGAGLAALAGGAAWAFVRSRASSGTGLYWPSSCVWVQPDQAGTPDLPLDTVVAVLDRSIANWQSRTADCAYLSIHRDPPAPLGAKLDRKNVVTFHTDKWCHPADGKRPEVCYPHEAVAITYLLFPDKPGKPDDGQILDADIELNDVDFTFVVEPADETPLKGKRIADLENTLTHELGHFQGLDHTCWVPSDVQPVPPLDDQGQPIPDCSDLDSLPEVERERIETATMFNYAVPGETSKRTPQADDLAGICSIYPKADDPKSCVRPDEPSGGCSLTTRRPASSPSLPSLLVACLVACGLVRRRYGTSL